MDGNLLHTIRTNMPSFSKGQKRIADYILSDYDKAAFMTASKLGATASVSESTVVRFATLLGYDGYPAMQSALQELVRSKLTSVQRMRSPQNRLDGQDILSSVMLRDADNIREATRNVDRDTFDRVVDKLLQAQHIYVLGIRSSSYLAGYLVFYMRLLMNNVTLVRNASVEIFEQLSHINEGDVLLAMSFPRYSKQVCQAAEFARSKGAQVFALTDTKLSPLVPFAQEALYVNCDAISFIDSMAAPLSLLNALIMALGKEKEEDTFRLLADMEQIWNRYDIFEKAKDE